MKRTIVVVPAEDESDNNEYFRNFVWRVHDAIKRDKLDAVVLVAAPPVKRVGGVK